MRRTASLSPIYKNSGVLLSWFAGKEALELETLSDEEIIDGVSTTLSSFLSQPHKQLNSNSHGVCNGKEKSVDGNRVRFANVLKSKWGNDPLFLGSYSYVAVGSSGDDLDTLAEPLPNTDTLGSAPLQILFAGEATHRTHYSTTHGAYFSGLREASRLLQHYHCVGV
jgi:spermine oxidase